MKKIYCTICGKTWKIYEKYKKPKMSYMLEKTLGLYIICSKCENEDEEIFQEE